MSDLTERLRRQAFHPTKQLQLQRLRDHAADRIEELEAALLGAQKTNGRLVVEKLHLKAAIHNMVDDPEHAEDIARRALGDNHE